MTNETNNLKTTEIVWRYDAAKDRCALAWRHGSWLTLEEKEKYGPFKDPYK